jgi:hypothetical protein
MAACVRRGRRGLASAGLQNVRYTLRALDVGFASHSERMVPACHLLGGFGLCGQRQKCHSCDQAGPNQASLPGLWRVQPPECVGMPSAVPPTMNVEHTCF